jgi:hypothetical protein
LELKLDGKIILICNFNTGVHCFSLLLIFFSFLLLIAGFQLSTYGRDIAMGGAKEWVGWVMAHPKILKNL